MKAQNLCLGFTTAADVKESQEGIEWDVKFNKLRYQKQMRREECKESRTLAGRPQEHQAHRSLIGTSHLW